MMAKSSCMKQSVGQDPGAEEDYGKEGGLMARNDWMELIAKQSAHKHAL